MSKRVPDCAHTDSCDCISIKNDTCNQCKLYHPIDSDHGWCKALPVFEITPWCRDICSLFQRV